MGHQHPPSVATRLDRASNPQQPQASVQAMQQTMAMGAQLPRNMYPSLVDGPPVTQPSSISVASGSQLKQHDGGRRGGNRTAVAAIAGVLLGASVLASAVVYRSMQGKAKVSSSTPATGDPSGAASLGTATATATVALATPSEGSDAGLAAADPASSSTAPVAPVASVAPKASATSKPRPQSVGATGRPTATADVKPPPTVSADCTTPVWFDAQGVKHYKPQCLDK